MMRVPRVPNEPLGDDELSKALADLIAHGVIDVIYDLDGSIRYHRVGCSEEVN